jgi:hypothetical protein
MSLSTKATTVNRQEKTEELLKHHDWKFGLLQEDSPLFIPKCAYIPKGMGELHIGFFASELKKGRDIYTEFTSIDLEPEDPSRTLYKWRFNPHYDEEYEKTEPAANGHFRYLVPVSELIKVEIVPEELEAPSQFPDFEGIMDPNTDAPLSQLTIRDIAAIMLKKPVSQKKWLNDLINS